MKSEIWTREERIQKRNRNRPVAWLPNERPVWEDDLNLTAREWVDVIIGAAVLIAVFVGVLAVVSLV